MGYDIRTALALPLQLRPIEPSQCRQLWALDQICFPRGIAYSEAEIRALVHQGARGRHLAAFLDGVLLGFILTLLNRSRGHVITLDVSPEYRQQGVGQALMGAVETFYRERRSLGMRLEAAVNNAPALRFYAGLGYRVVRTLPAYYAPNLDGLLLHKAWPPHLSAPKL